MKLFVIVTALTLSGCGSQQNQQVEAAPSVRGRLSGGLWRRLGTKCDE